MSQKQSHDSRPPISALDPDGLTGRVRELERRLANLDAAIAGARRSRCVQKEGRWVHSGPLERRLKSEWRRVELQLRTARRRLTAIRSE
ncbi:MAG: hypothetical protein KGR26_09620 [Cyanobacteria bacterium REEB65]|nr:hypothetical protein [Cyanobacteria bacterium REEB65]